MTAGTLYCAFCRKSMHEVRVLVRGWDHSAYICDGCLSLGVEIVAKKRGRREMVAADIGLIEVTLFRVQGGGQ